MNMSGLGDFMMGIMMVIVLPFAAAVSIPILAILKIWCDFSWAWLFLPIAVLLVIWLYVGTA